MDDVVTSQDVMVEQRLYAYDTIGNLLQTRLTLQKHTASRQPARSARTRSECACNEFWSCPITPAENRLKVRIEAGEKSFH